MPGVQHAYPLTGLTLIWGQKHQNNNLPSPPLLILTLDSFPQSLSKPHVTLHFVMSLLKAVTHSFVDYVSVSMTLDFY